MRRTTISILAAISMLTSCSEGGGTQASVAGKDGPEADAAAEVTASESAESPGFSFKVSGAFEDEIRGPGQLRCIDLGDAREQAGYLRLDNGTATGTVAFNLPLDATEGEHALVYLNEGQEGSRSGEAYTVDVSLPLHPGNFIPPVDGALTLEELGTSPGERIRGRFHFTGRSSEKAFATPDSMEPIEFEGSFEFVVGEDARERC